MWGVALSAAMIAGSVLAQQPARGTSPAGGGAAGATDEKVKIIRFPQSPKASMIRTPVFNVNVSGLQNKLSGKLREWAVFEIQYQTGAKWTDELAFTYHVMTKGKDDDGKDIFNYYTATVRYIDIPKGNHMSCVVLPPSQIERYGEPVSLALEIIGKDGTVLVSQFAGDGGKDWWRDPRVLDQPHVKRRAGLVDRSKTPFALINLDDYEVVQ